MHQAESPLVVFGELEQSRPLRSVLVLVYIVLRAVEHRLHLGIVLHPSVQPLVVAAVILVACGGRYLHQGVVGIFAGREQHRTFPLALEVACINAGELPHKAAQNEAVDCSTKLGVQREIYTTSP